MGKERCLGNDGRLTAAHGGGGGGGGGGRGGGFWYKGGGCNGALLHPSMGRKVSSSAPKKKKQKKKPLNSTRNLNFCRRAAHAVQRSLLNTGDRKAREIVTQSKPRRGSGTGSNAKRPKLTARSQEREKETRTMASEGWNSEARKTDPDPHLHCQGATLSRERWGENVNIFRPGGLARGSQPETRSALKEGGKTCG